MSIPATHHTHPCARSLAQNTLASADCTHKHTTKIHKNIRKVLFVYNMLFIFSCCHTTQHALILCIYDICCAIVCVCVRC